MATNKTNWTQYREPCFPPTGDGVERVPRVQRTLNRRNRTLFKPYEASDNNLRLFRRIKDHQLDIETYREDVDIDEKTREEYKYWMITTLGQQLDLPVGMIARSRDWFMSLDLQKLGHTRELVAFCILIYNMKEQEKREQSPWDRAYHPSRSTDKNDERVRELIEELPPEFNITKRNIRKLFGKLGQNPDIRNVSERAWSDFEIEEPPL